MREPSTQDLFSPHYITYRRLWLDKLLQSFASEMRGRVMDIGGKRKNKRGSFQPPHEQAQAWFYVNLDLTTEPNLFADVSALPVQGQSVDVVICTEVLEHLSDPQSCAAEILRILKPGGMALLSVPFLYPVHADPEDFQRFTADGLKRLFSPCASLEVWPMGGFLGVLGMFLEIGLPGIRGNSLDKKILRRFLTWLSRQLCAQDLRTTGQQPEIWKKFTTGYFLRVVK
jgi:SAM-dependent methyltransferase